MLSFHYVQKDGQESLTLIVDGVPEVVPTSHTNFTAIRDALMAGDIEEDEVKTLLNARRIIPAKLANLSERISLREGKLFFDGDPIDTALSRHIIRLAEAGDEGLKAFVKFMENLATNPSPLSRIHLFKWVEGRDFTITDEGMIVGYKAVKKGADGNFVSITSGSNVVQVDGESVTGYVPNPIGAVIEIARSQVDPDRAVGCSHGLHVGTYRYAKEFGGYSSPLLKVLVNPRDVVSVPSDSANEKMRVCRYTVVETIEQEISSPLIFTSFGETDDDSVEDQTWPEEEDDEEDQWGYNSACEECGDIDCDGLCDEADHDYDPRFDDGEEMDECNECGLGYWAHGN